MNIQLNQISFVMKNVVRTTFFIITFPVTLTILMAVGVVIFVSRVVMAYEKYQQNMAEKNHFLESVRMNAICDEYNSMIRGRG